MNVSADTTASTKGPRFQSLPVNESIASESTKPQFRSWYTRWVPDGWGTEILSAAFGVLLVVALAITLQHFDGKPPPYLGHFVGSSVTLNTLLAFITTVAKAALLLPVAECVSQQKWLHFSGGYRQLSKLSSFDKASRGIFGSLNLLFETRIINMASLGALIMVYAIVIDPLSQQLVTTVTRMVPNNDAVATTPMCREWTDTSSWTVPGEEPQIARNSAVSLSLKGAVYSGLYADTDTIQDLSPDCPGGSCTFEPYLSIAVCPSFANVTSSLYTKNQTFAYYQGFVTNDTAENVPDVPYWYLTDNAYVAAGLFQETPGFGLGNITSAIHLNPIPNNISTFLDSIAFKDAVAPIADFFIIYAVAAPPTQFQAVEVLLEWCLQNYTTEVSGGTVTNTRGNTLNATSSLNFTIPDAENSGLDAPAYIDPQTHANYQRQLASLLSGGATGSTNINPTTASSEIAELLFEPFEPFTFMPAGAPWALGDSKIGLLGQGEAGMEHMINNLATSMTNLIRTASNKNTTTPTLANGTVLVSTEFVVIRWKWISVLVIFTALSITFLAVTIAAQSTSVLSQAAWKSSELAVLHALAPELQQTYGAVDTHGLLFGRDRQVQVRLQCVPGEGWWLLTRPDTHVDVHEDASDAE